MFLFEDDEMMIENPLDFAAAICEIVAEMDEYYGVR